MQRFSPKASSILEKKIFKGFYHIWAWWPSWSMDHDHFSNFLFLQPKEAPYEIWTKLAQGLQRRSFENVNGRTDDGRKWVTIAHPEHSSGELIKKIIPLSSAEFVKLKHSPCQYQLPTAPTRSCLPSCSTGNKIENSEYKFILKMTDIYYGIIN